MAPACDGLKVIDFSQGMAGSLATMILADNGAEVVKVEPPSGDPYRWMPPWLMWNRGKKSVVLELETEQGRGLALRLAQGADVVMESFVPGVADRLGIGYGTLAEVHPRLVHCSITALGSKGAYRHLPPYEGVVQAKAGGYMEAKNVMFRDDPTYRVRPNGSYGAGNLAVQGVLAAIRVRDMTGKGQHIETSLFQGYSCYDFSAAMNRQIELGLMTGHNLQPAAGRSQTFLNYLVARCKDGQWIQMTNNTARLFPLWMEAIGLGDVLKEPRFERAPVAFEDEEDRALLRRMILEATLEKTLDEWLELFIEKGVAGERFLTTQQCMEYPQTLHNGGVVEVDDPGVGLTKQIGPIAALKDTPAAVGTPAPTLGQHTEEVLAALEEANRATTNGEAPSGEMPKHPLEGLLVLDFASWLAAPFGMSLISELGARVIKVESPAGDEFRPTSKGRGRTFQGKDSLIVDLKTPEGREIAHKLIAKADGLMHNMRGDAAIRLGIDYDTVKQINPGIVYLYAGSYGSSGPGAGRPAFHPTAGALSGGALWQLGQGNEPPPNDEPLDIEELTQWSERLFRANEGSPDVTGAIAVATAMSLGFHARNRTGRGQYIETSMLNSNGYMCSEDFLSYVGKPPRMDPDRYLRGTHALHRLYQTMDGWLFVDCPTEGEWTALCHALSRTDLLEVRNFRDRETRFRNDGQLIGSLALEFGKRTASEWEIHFHDKGVAVARADEQTHNDFFLNDDSVKENGFIVHREHPVLGGMFRQGPPVNFLATPGKTELARLPGEDTKAILLELGFSDDDMLDLRGRGVVAWSGDRE